MYMNVYKFSIPDKNISIFRCEVYGECNNFLYSREVHLYDKNLSDELNVTVLSKKMADTLNVDEKDLYIPVRMAVLLGESTWANSKYSD